MKIEIELLAQLATNLILVLQANPFGGLLLIGILLGSALILFLRKK